MNSLEAAVNTQADRQKELIHLVEDSVEVQRKHNAAIQALSTISENLTTQLGVAFASLDGLIITNMFRHALFITNASIDKYVRVVEAAHNHRLAFGLVSFADAAQVVKDLSELARYQNFHLALSKPQHLLQCPVTMALLDDGIRLYVHINAFSGSPLDLYKYHPWPLSAPNGLSVLVSPDHQFLAVNDDDGTYVELRNGDLHTCQKFHGFFVCPHIQVVSKRKRKSCLSSLFYSEFNNTMNYCPVKLLPHSDVVLPLDNNAFISRTQNPVSVRQQCNNGSVSHFQLATTAKIVVDSECFLDLPDFRLYSLSGINHNYDLNHYTWPLNFTEMFNGTDPAQMSQLLHDIKKTALPPNDPHVLNALHRLEATSPSAYVTHWPFLTVAAGAAASLLVGLLLLGLIYGAYRRKSTTTARPVPSSYELVPSVQYLAKSGQLLYPDLSTEKCGAINPELLQPSAPPSVDKHRR